VNFGHFGPIFDPLLGFWVKNAFCLGPIKILSQEKLPLYEMETQAGDVQL